MSKLPSFQFYPGDWRKSKWVTYEFSTNIWKVKPIPGCYVVYADNELIYVGQSFNVSKRLLSYKFRYGYGGQIFSVFGIFNLIAVKVRYSTKFGDWAMREVRLIHKLKPRFNCVGSVKKRMEIKEENFAIHKP